MADDTPTKAESDEQKPKGKLPIKTIIIILGVLLLEGGTISMFTILKGDPQPAAATSPIEGTVDKSTKPMFEVSLAENFSVDNYTRGKSKLVVTMHVTAKVDESRKDQLTKKVEASKSEIKDGIRALVSTAQPDEVRDSKLQVIKREIKSCVEKIIGEGMVEEILISEWQTYTAD